MDARNRYIGKKELREITDISYQTWWRLERANEAPARIRISAGRVVWRLSDVLEWCESRQKVEACPPKKLVNKFDTTCCPINIEQTTMEVDFTCKCSGAGMWTGHKQVVHCVALTLKHHNDNLDSGELLVDFNNWDTAEHGMIYTDPQFESELKKQLSILGLLATNIRYSEQGMQTKRAVSFDVDTPFLVSWMRVYLANRLDRELKSPGEVGDLRQDLQVWQENSPTVDEPRSPAAKGRNRGLKSRKQGGENHEE